MPQDQQTGAGFSLQVSLHDFFVLFVPFCGQSSFQWHPL